ncbi:hypothetical protein Desor_1795 [Desulfosporosinus orientis DSM 765]|uniref:DUF5071 domain-containing protein n=1 Tax=Desulfosporosinus orientis (strain ATCC 19365 / DSM 765 / NCIMB 8382 / VKM B-1628 / Singapore I) TaxID=768706 RepID=G7W8K4_DESOD|nr:DUF5071 domain-containing protein [Desulfosporosinus orientis]AET67431.1 hypothetical protein Desor_1795 [Desulfosporosinus orientis DSM 765]
MVNIKELIRDLDWSKPEEVQKKAIEKLQEIEELDLVYLVQLSELNHKFCWHNAAIVLKSIGYPRIKPIIPYLMEWFQDVNWPGVNTIREILKSMDSNELMPYIEEAAKRVLSENDDLWAFGLILLLRDIGVEDFNDGHIFEELYKLSGMDRG